MQSPTSPASPPIICGKCSGAVLSGSAFMSWLTGVGCTNEVDTNGSVTIEDHGTGATIQPITDTSWAISNPQHSGSITVKATVSGQCGCTNAQSVTLTEEGTLIVIVPTDEEGGCSACSGTCSGNIPSLGNGSVNSSTDNGVDFNMSLGPDNTAHDAGALLLQANTAGSALSTPGPLVAVPGPDTTVLLSSGAVHQIKSPQGLVHVNTISSYEYHIECYYDSDYNHTPQSDGFYLTNSGAQPFVVWKVVNPDGASATSRLTITESRGGVDRAFQFTNTPSSLRWDLGRPDSSVVGTWRAQVSSGITNITRQVSTGSQVTKKRQDTYQTITGLSYPLLTQTVEGDTTVSQTTTYQYYSSDPSNGAFTNKIQRVDYPDGQWTYLVYDSLGRTQTVYSTYGNNPPPSSGVPNPPTDQCRVTEYYYALTNATEGVDDPGTGAQQLARRVVVKVPVGSSMAEVSRTLRVASDMTDIKEEACPSPGAKWGDAGNVREETAYFDIDDPRGWKPITVYHPDGTITYFNYTDDGALTMRATLDSASSFPYSIANGQETDISLNSWGQPTSRITTAYSSGAGIATEYKTYAYTTIGGGLIDPLGRSYDLTDVLASLTTQFRYACCGLDTVTDPDGAVTSYDYDQLKRQVAVTHTYGSTSIKTTNILDSAGRTLVTKRIGSDNSVIMQSGTQFDALGRPMCETNALLGVTTITNVIVSNRRCVTNIYPDGGTRIETYHRDGRPESISGTAARPVQYYYGAEEDGTNYREFTLEVKLDLSGGTNEWVKTLFDGAGRAYKTVYSAPNTPYPFSAVSYNDAGQKIAERDADGVTNLFTYNSVGELQQTAVDLDWDGAISTALDRVTQIDKTYLGSDSTRPNRTQTKTSGWVSNGGTSVQKTLSVSEVSASGLQSWRAVYRDSSIQAVTYTTNVYSTGGNRYATNIAPDWSYSVTAYLYGRLNWVKRFDSGNSQISSVTYAYDAHGRQSSTTDVRNGTTSYAFNNADLVTSVTTPDPGVIGDAPQTTTTVYNNMLQATSVIQPDSGAVSNEYYLTGDLKRMYGARTYPVGYGYDAQGRMKYMTNWSNFGSGSGARVTMWNYDAYRGWLISKRYPDASTGNPGTLGPDYTYTAAGRLKSRVWARVGTGGLRIATTNTYGFEISGDKHGDLAGIAYYNDPQSTPSVVYTYDRLGRQATIARNGITNTLAYNDANEVQSESYNGGTLDGLSITNGWDEFLRRTNLAGLNSSVPLFQHSFSYDAASRLGTVTDYTTSTNLSATYSYLANSPLVSQIVFKQGTATRMTTTKQWDFLNRLSSISSLPSASPAVSFAYQYNDANQRTSCRWADGSLWIYEYDPLGQLITAKRFWPDWTPVAGQRFAYTFDDIGNRTATKAGGDETGSSLRSANYSANYLNQYTSRDVPGAVDIMGLALATETVQVNGASPYRKGEYFRKEVSVANSSAPAWESITVTATGETNVTGHEFVPQTPEAFTYDDDGNLTSDGRWTNSWDAENRLVRMESLTNGPAGSKLRLTFGYDHRSRRVNKQVENWSGSVWNTTVSNKFVYDGWNLVAVLNGTNNAAIQRFLWGGDLSGSMQGAGGVGGLLAMSDLSAGPHFAAFDANGNVSALIIASDGTASANYEYGPFGELLRATGPMAKANPFRFSTKYQDDETDLLYYGYRYYNASTGRWLSRDPLGEKTSMNLFECDRNDPISRIDVLGLDTTTPNSPDDAKALCNSCLQRSGTVTPPGPDNPLPDSFCAPVASLLRTDPDLQALVKAFNSTGPGGKSCPLPKITCRFCGDPANCGQFQAGPGGGLLVICARELDTSKKSELKTTLLHELTHALQACKRGGTPPDGCQSALFDEMQAYYCAGQCNSLSDCLGRAIASSCAVNGFCSSGDQASSAYNALAQAWNNKSIQSCFGPRPAPVPSEPQPGKGK
jgi:RHS repeat-associated protein